MLKFIVDYLQCLRVIIYHVQECLNRELAFAAVVSVSVMMFVLERHERQYRISQVETCILADRRVAVHELANKLSLSVGSVETIIH